MRSEESTEVMRHVPGSSVLARKLGSDLGRALEILQKRAQRSEDEQSRLAIRYIGLLQKDLDRLGRILRLNGNSEARKNESRSLAEIVQCLERQDELAFRRRVPLDSFIRGVGERAWCTVAAATARAHEAIQALAAIEPGVYEEFLPPSNVSLPAPGKRLTAD